MSLLNRYLTKAFVRYFLLTFFTLTGLFVLVALFENMRLFMKYDASFSDGLTMVVGQIPWIATQTLPLSALMGALIALTIMAKNGELTVLRSAGLPLYRLSLPLLLCGAFVALGTYSLQEWVAPHTNAIVREVKQVAIKGRRAETMSHSTDVWFRSGEAFVHAELITGDRRLIKGIEIYEVSNGEIPRTIFAKEAKWTERGWILEGVSIVATSGEMAWRRAEEEELTYSLAPDPEDIYISRNEPAEMNMKELGKTIKSRRAQALSVTNLEVDFWAKSALPFSAILMTLIAVPFASRVSGRGGLWGAVTRGIGFGLLFFLLFMFSTSIGKTGSLSPPVAAWLPNVIFTILALYLLLKAEKAR
ncbi:MAG: LPS export ABC transporter permease LptG [Deltaproteobacteria bacterium]|nr:MAG: LPS export ABC transporter permease LptG [Deltaproteobacteria bacterium]